MKSIKKAFLFFVILSFPLVAKTQNLKRHIWLGGSYTYFNKSFGSLDAKYFVSDYNLMLGTNILIGASNKKMLVIPEINATKYLGKDILPSPFVRLHLSPKTIGPQLGVSVLFAEFALGYGFAMANSSNYQTKGFRMQINFNIPLDFRL